MALIYPLDWRYFHTDEMARCHCNADAILMVVNDNPTPFNSEPRCEDHMFAGYQFTVQVTTNGVMKFTL